MATSLNLIRTLTIQAQTKGVDQAAASLEKFAGSTEKAATSSVKLEKATTSTDAAFQKLQRRYDQELRAQQDLQRAQQTLDRARQQGLVSQERQNQLMQLAIRHHNTAGDAAKKHSVALEELSNHANALSGELGAAGNVLSRFGVAGLAIAATLGGLALAFTEAAKSALELADTAGKLVDLSDTVGLTVVQLQGLEHAAAQVGINFQALETGLEKFVAVFGQLRDSQKGAIEAFERLGAGFAQTVANSTSMDEALNKVFNQLAKVDVVTRGLAARELFGKGGTNFGRLAQATVEAGGSIDDLVSKLNQLDIITREQGETWDRFGDIIKLNLKLAQQNLVATFTGPTLAIVNQLSEALLDLARSAKEIGTPLADAFGETILANVVALRTEVDTFVKSLDGLSAQQIGQKISDALIDPRVIQFFKDLGDVIKASIDLIAAYLAALGRLRAFDIGGVQAAVAQAGQAFGNLTTSLSNLGTTLRGETNPALTTTSNTIDTATNETQDFSAQIAKLNLTPSFTIKPEARQSFKAVQLAAEDTGKAIKEKVNPAITELSQVAGQLGSSLVSAFLKGDDAAKALRGTLQSIASSATSSSISKLVTGDLPGAAVKGLAGGKAADMFAPKQEKPIHDGAQLPKAA